MKFTDINLSEDILQGIDAMGFEEMTPIQEQAIPQILDGQDLIASAQTGTGKTAAFLLPLIEKISQSQQEGIKALIIVPTRELAVQIHQNMEGMSYFTSVASVAVYGGGDSMLYSHEKQALIAGVDVVIGTPGRLISHSNMSYVNWSNLQFLILDEADRMLDMGFHDDIMRIIDKLPQKRQTLLFSATMPSDMRQLARKLLHQPKEINIAISKPAEKIKQSAFVVFETQKIPLVKDIVAQGNYQSVLVFCSTKKSVKDLYRTLKEAHFSVAQIHSDLEQAKREEVLSLFKQRKTKILVATDILSRGIDIEDIDMVINFDVPPDAEDYVHRIGRTARAAADGLAFTLIAPKDQRRFFAIEKLIEKEITKEPVPESLGETPSYNPNPTKKRKPYYRKKKRFSKNNGQSSPKSSNSSSKNQVKKPKQSSSNKS